MAQVRIILDNVSTLSMCTSLPVLAPRLRMSIIYLSLSILYQFQTRPWMQPTKVLDTMVFLYGQFSPFLTIHFLIPSKRVNFYDEINSIYVYAMHCVAKNCLAVGNGMDAALSH